MIYIITGPVNSGKSTRLLKIYNNLKTGTGDGFYLKKFFIGSAYIGQEIVHLSTAISMPFSYIDGITPSNWDEACKYKNYSFSRLAIEYAGTIANTDADIFFIDELGPLELENNGFYGIFNKLLKTDKDIYAVIRQNSLNDIIKNFNIKNYLIF